MVNQGNSSSPLSSSRQTSPERSMLEDPNRSKCSCGTGDGTGDYIYCDNETCEVGWYHWECVQVTEIPAGTWLCPSCSPSAAFYIKQLVKQPPAPSPVSKLEKAQKPAGSIGKLRERRSAASSSTPRLNKTAERSGSKGMEQEQGREVANKGIAVKKPAAKTPKPKWKGWVELTSDGEEDFKKKVDAHWSVEDAVIGKRTRGSKAVDEESETTLPRPSRRSRLRSKRRIVETTSDEEQGESFHQQDQQEEAMDSEESVYQEEKKKKTADSNDSEDTMDMDEGAKDADKDSADDPSDSSTNPREERQTSPDPVRRDVTSDWEGRKKFIDVETEDREDSMDMGFRDENPEISGSDPSEGSEYVDDNNSSASTEIRAVASSVREEADATSPPPVSLLANNPAGPSAVYKRQGTCWGEFRESAIRSTLPRLG